MNFIYSYIQSKIIERVISGTWEIIKNGGFKKIKDNTYDMLTDPLWSSELQKYYIGTQLIEISSNDEDLILISNESLDEKEKHQNIKSQSNNIEEVMKNPHEVGNGSDSDNDDDPHAIGNGTNGDNTNNPHQIGN